MADDPTTAPPADPPADPPPPPADSPADPPATGEDALPEGAKKALAAARKDAREAQKAARELAAQVKQFEDRDKSEADKASDRATAAEQRAAALLTRTVRAEVRALAAETFADPADAAAFLDLAGYADDAGEVDADKIKTDLAELLTRKPHLAKTPGRTGPKPDPSQGGHAPTGIDEQIAAAKKAGEWTKVISLENQKLVPK
jgi:hypothetical protein